MTSPFSMDDPSTVKLTDGSRPGLVDLTHVAETGGPETVCEDGVETMVGMSGNCHHGR